MGAGVTGAGIALDAARRALSVVIDGRAETVGELRFADPARERGERVRPAGPRSRLGLVAADRARAVATGQRVLAEGFWARPGDH